MQNPSDVSLNALRVFDVVARHRSIKLAANELLVTPSAVSHQIKSLEESLGVSLFDRRNNAITLNGPGRQLHGDITPGLTILKNATQAFLRDTDELVIKVSVSLAVRWLIPALAGFKRENPGARIHIETTHDATTQLSPDLDMAIYYSRQPWPRTDGVLLFDDMCQAVLSPTLLKESGYQTPDDIGSIPIMSCTVNHWDWQNWSEATGFSANYQEPAHVFDTDDAAIHGTIAGMGMMLASTIMTTKEIASGSLVALPDAPSQKMGEYRLLMAPRASPLANRFKAWLMNEARRATSS